MHNLLIEIDSVVASLIKGAAAPLAPLAPNAATTPPGGGLDAPVFQDLPAGGGAGTTGAGLGPVPQMPKAPGDAPAGGGQFGNVGNDLMRAMNATGQGVQDLGQGVRQGAQDFGNRMQQRAPGLVDAGQAVFGGGGHHLTPAAAPTSPAPAASGTGDEGGAVAPTTPPGGGAGTGGGGMGAGGGGGAIAPPTPPVFGRDTRPGSDTAPGGIYDPATYGSEPGPTPAATPQPVDAAGEMQAGQPELPEADMSNVYWKQIQRLQGELADPNIDPRRQANAQRDLQKYQRIGQTSPEYMRRREKELAIGGMSPEAIEAWKQRRDLFSAGEENAFNPGMSQASRVRTGPASNIQNQLDAVSGRGERVDPNSTLARNAAQLQLEGADRAMEDRSREMAQTPPEPTMTPQERLGGAGEGIMPQQPEGPSDAELAGAGDSIISPPGGMQRASMPAGGPKAPDDMRSDRLGDLPAGPWDIEGPGRTADLPPSSIDLMGPDTTPRPPRRSSPSAKQPSPMPIRADRSPPPMWSGINL